MLALTFILSACSTNQTTKAGASNDRLFPCPKSPNCVSSLSQDESHYIEPLKYEGTAEEARENLISVINSMKRSEIVTVETSYIHTIFKNTVCTLRNQHSVFGIEI